MIAIAVDITNRPVSPQKVISSVAHRSAGGTVSFVGTVRDRAEGVKVSSMLLEAAADLAKKDLTRICSEAKSKFEVSRISIAHRVGKLKVGDVIIVLAVSAPHRKEAFGACKYIIDELKKTTPIWKKELGPGSARWVEGGV